MLRATGYPAEIAFFSVAKRSRFFSVAKSMRLVMADSYVGLTGYAHVDGSLINIRKEKVADSKISGYVWTRPKKLINFSAAGRDLRMLALFRSD